MRLSGSARTIVLTIAILVSCGKREIVRPPFAAAPECHIVPAPSAPADTVTVALSDEASPEYAPWGRNPGEQLVFNHLYETLIELDCLGESEPALAGSWASGENGRRWSFELREGVHFWDGSPVRAEDVVASWERNAVEPMTLYALIDSVTTSGERVVNVHFKEPHRRVPGALSAPAFAVTRPSAGSPWLLGTGPYPVVTAAGESIGARASRNGQPVIRFVVTANIDARDLLEGTIDAMVTTDRSVIGYANGHPEFETVALPWDRSYLLLSTSRVQELLRGGAVGTVTPEFCDALARDAVKGIARGFREPPWWQAAVDCETAGESEVPPLPRGAYGAPGTRRVLFDAGDPVARSLAERIVALATSDPTATSDAAVIAGAVPGLDSDWPRTVAEGVSTADFAVTLRHGDDFAYVIAIPRLPPDPCYGARELLDRAPWLRSVGDAVRSVVIPLVDTRPYAIARRAKTGLVVDGYGFVFVSTGATIQ